MKQTKMQGDSCNDRVLLLCNCGGIDHQLMFSWYSDDLDEEDKCMFMSWVVAPRSLWHRIKCAITHIFSGKTIHIEEVVLDEKDVKEIQQGLNKFLKHRKKY